MSDETNYPAVDVLDASVSLCCPDCGNSDKAAMRVYTMIWVNAGDLRPIPGVRADPPNFQDTIECRAAVEDDGEHGPVCKCRGSVGEFQQEAELEIPK